MGRVNSTREYILLKRAIIAMTWVTTVLIIVLTVVVVMTLVLMSALRPSTSSGLTKATLCLQELLFVHRVSL